MARYYKKWEDHSPRWQREAKKSGLTSQRWNSWLKLSDKTRKASDPRKYAAGTSVATQQHERNVQQAAKKIVASGTRQARTSVVLRNVGKMSNADLQWTIKASPAQIRNRASQKHVAGYATNPWWYM